MKKMETGPEKLKKICDLLRRETIEPAQENAKQIIAKANVDAEQIIQEAKQQGERIIAQAKRAIEQERNVFLSSLSQAGKQSLEALRQDIERKLFSPELENIIREGSHKADIVAKFIHCIVAAIEKEGIGAELSAYIPQSLKTEEVNKLLAQNIIKKLRENSVQIGNFAGGAKVRVQDRKMTIDISDSALQELLSSYVRKDFRKMLFGST